MSITQFTRFYFALNSFLLLCSGTAVAQNPDDNFTVHSFNGKFLEHLIKEKIDSVRLAHNLKTLHNDSILFVAAKFHANYLFNKKELSHTEPENPITETPQKRADHFGAVNYLVGENVAFTYVGIPSKDKKGKVSTNSTYNQTATDFAVMWVHSPGHYKNIIMPDYNATGVAVWADTKTNRVYAVQKFADILYRYQFDENKNFFSYSNYVPEPVVSSFEGIPAQLHKGKHAYKLKNPKKESQCERCYMSPGFQFGLSRIEARDGKIYFSSYDLQSILTLLKKKKDGFAVELISYDPYDCGNPQYYTDPSRRNKQCVFSGKVLKPVYKKKAIKGFKAGTKVKKIKTKIDANKIKKYEIKLGKLPKDLTEYVELNLVIIQKKKVCRIMRFSGYCGDTLERFYNLPLYVDSVPQGADITEAYKNVQFSIPFQKGKTDYNMSDIKPITDSLLSENFTADSIIIKAFSSVEGKEDLNKKLQDQRAFNIAKALEKNQKEKLNTVIVSIENWELFEKQIKEKEVLKELRGLSHEKIKEVLLDTLKQKKFEPYLKDQRIAYIRLRAREIINEKNIERYLTTKIRLQKQTLGKLLAEENKKPEVVRSYLDSLELFMNVAYGYIKKKVIKPEFFENFRIVNSKALNSYNIMRLKYLAKLDSSKIADFEWSRQFYGDLVYLYNNKESSFFIDYNMDALIQLYGKRMNVSIPDDQQDNYLGELNYFVRDSLQKKLAQKLELNFWFSVCSKTKEETPKDKQELHYRCLTNIHNYFNSKKIDLAEKNKICYYYIYHSRADWATELLWPDYQNKIDNPEGLVILAKVLYENYQETKDPAYYEFLKEIYGRMGEKTWCPMFVGPCNISFQALDYENFRNFYCEKCSSYLNYAKAPDNVK
ncbi:hypothetical protein CNR22_12100 [Sphingobacteriaceae bacterium]|nr:hypothetical protein CNR22_12100 [Sphingobacteriaceae bacterium]